MLKTGNNILQCQSIWNDLCFRHELAIQALQTGDQDDNSLIEHKKEQDQNLVIENQMVELGLTQQVGDPTLNFVWQYNPCLIWFFRMLYFDLHVFKELSVPTSGAQGDLGQQAILAADSLDNFQQALNQQVC